MSTRLTQETVDAILVADDLATHPVDVINGIKVVLKATPLVVLLMH